MKLGGSWLGEHWPLILFPALATGGSVVAAVRVDGWAKDFNWWLVIIGAAGLGLALGTAIWNAIVTRSNAKATNELAANQKRIADLTEEVATNQKRLADLTGELAGTARTGTERDVAKPVIIWRTDYPYIRDADEKGYRIRFWLVNRGQRPTSVESLSLILRTARSRDPLLAESYDWPGKSYAFWPVDEWNGQGHFTVPPGTHRAFDIQHVFEPAEKSAMQKRPPLLVVETVVGECPPSVVGTGQTLDDEDPAVEAFLEEQAARYEADYKEHRRQQRMLPPVDEGEETRERREIPGGG